MSFGIGLFEEFFTSYESRIHSVIAEYGKGIFSFLMAFILAKVSEEKNQDWLY